MATKQIKRRDLEEWKRFCEYVEAATDVAAVETEAERADMIGRLLSDYNFFVKTIFPHYCDDGKTDCGYFHIDAANKIEADPNILAILEWPREHAKSVHANIFMPLWLKAKKQLSGMILVGKNETDGCNLLSDVQAELQFNKLYVHYFGEQYSFGSWETGDFTTRDGIRFTAIGRGQSPRGMRKNEKRPNYAVIDDIDDDEVVNNQKRVRKIVKWIFGALYFALSIKGARMIMAGNRIHAQSILAHVVGDIKPNAPKREDIYHSKVFATENAKHEKCYINQGGQPAWKERYTIEELQRKIKKAGIFHKAEFYHENAIEGTIFKDEMIQWKPMPSKTWGRYKVIIGYLDPSFENKATSDFKAVSVWGLYINSSLGYEFHCLKKFTQRAELEQAYAFMSRIDDTIQTGVGVIWYCEEQFFNRPMQQALQRHNAKRRGEGKKQLMVTIDKRDKENKYTRIVKMEPEYSDRNVYYNIDEFHNADMLEGIDQLKGIEPGYSTPDDSPDSDEGAWYYLYPHLPTNNFPPIIRKQTRSNGW